MKRVEKENVVYVMSKDNPSVLAVAPGESFRVATQDAYGGAIQKAGDVFPAAVRPNGATGPIWISGSDAGDILRVDIERIDIADRGVMSSPDSQVFPIRKGEVVLRRGVSVPAVPMIGVIGTAPAGSGVPNTTPGPHGGNMDCKDIREGASVFLPVGVDGALLALGDVHALMGDGEVCGCGIEVEAEVTLRTWIVREMLPTPCVETSTHLCFLGSAHTLDECEGIVIRQARRFLTDWLELDETEAMRTMSLVGDLGVCQVVDPLKTMRFALPKDVLTQFGLRPLSGLNRRA